VFYWGLIIGVFIGCFIGIFISGLCVMARKGDVIEVHPAMEQAEPIQT
jgi:hypothetical protein